jgi:hypothetical protein
VGSCGDACRVKQAAAGSAVAGSAAVGSTGSPAVAGAAS